jgi:hypothetical protein
MLERFPLHRKEFVEHHKSEAALKTADGSDDNNSENSVESDYSYSGFEFTDPMDPAVIESLQSNTCSCNICCCPAGSKPMTVTRCCRTPICDTSANYVMFSYSREHCERSHERYTLCGYHGVESVCDKTLDWRECEGCNPLNAGTFSIPDKLWRGLNPYNFCPLLEARVPRHSMCEMCTKCGQKFMSGLEVCSYSSGGLSCARCAATSSHMFEMAMEV